MSNKLLTEEEVRKKYDTYYNLYLFRLQFHDVDEDVEAPVSYEEFKRRLKSND